MTTSCTEDTVPRRFVFPLLFFRLYDSPSEFIVTRRTCNWIQPICYITSSFFTSQPLPSGTGRHPSINKLLIIHELPPPALPRSSRPPIHPKSRFLISKHGSNQVKSLNRLTPLIGRGRNVRRKNGGSTHGGRAAPVREEMSV